MSCQRRAQAHPGEKVVHGAIGHHTAWRNSALRVYLYRDVLHLHVVLGLQDLLCLRIHASSFSHPHHWHSLRHHRMHLFPSKRRGLPMAGVITNQTLFTSH